jgi:hypothetical protein
MSRLSRNDDERGRKTGAMYQRIIIVLGEIFIDEYLGMRWGNSRAIIVFVIKVMVRRLFLLVDRKNLGDIVDQVTKER